MLKTMHYTCLVNSLKIPLHLGPVEFSPCVLDRHPVQKRVKFDLNLD